MFRGSLGKVIQESGLRAHGMMLTSISVIWTDARSIGDSIPLREAAQGLKQSLEKAVVLRLGFLLSLYSVLCTLYMSILYMTVLWR